ncbi:MAG: multidrug efflux pump subunit AcrB [Hyphomicrobiaceae bacterium]|jgi:multidrug efflux pump subunit AcrB
MLTEMALRNRSLILAAILVCLVWGPLSLITHPSREDPSITIRGAQVIARFEGMSADRIENLITTRLEEKVREIPEIDKIETISSTGQSLVKINVADKYTDMAPIWAELRNKMDDVRAELPSGTSGPFVHDDQGNVAMATIAMTADGFSIAEIVEAAKVFRRLVYAHVKGVRKVEFFGDEDQRIFVEFDNVTLSRMGLSPDSIRSAISQQNVVLPGGRIEADGKSFTVEPSGDFGNLDDLKRISIAVPGGSSSIYLSDIAKISFGYEQPPRKPAFFNGQPAVVVSVSMVDQYNAFAFGKQLEGVMKSFETSLPVGFTLSPITWQSDEIADAVVGVFNNLWQTVLIVLIVVIAFLGFRTGLIVGAMVPLVMVISTIVMRMTGIELERMSLASLIIALGLLVDNGIVVAQDMQSRLLRGEDRIQAAKATGRSLALPLLAASLTTILAFMPLMLAPGGAGEYTRSISLVITIALLVSWIVALTALILFCVWFLKVGEPVDDSVAYGGWMYQRYRAGVAFCLRWRYGTIAVAFSTLFVGIWMFQFVSKTFFPQSERTQLQVIVELPQGHNTYATRQVTRQIETWLQNTKVNPEVSKVATYIAGGGPRFYLALSPVDGTPNTAYMLVDVKQSKDVRTLQARLQKYAADRVPEAEIYAKPMSMGPSEAGLVEFRIIGSDEKIIKRASEQLQLALRRIEGTVDITDDWKNPTITLRAMIDQNAAQRTGTTSQDIANALNSQLSGSEVTTYRVGDISIPVIFRTVESQRTKLDRLRSLNVAVTGGSPVPLGQVAKLKAHAGFSQVRRLDLERVMTVSGKSLRVTAAELDARMAPEVASLLATLPPGYRIEKGGEIEGSSDAQGALFGNVPIAFALMFLVLIWQFDSFVKPVIVLLTIPLVITGVAMSLLIMPGANFSFMGILGLLALSGIVINNAIVLIDRIDQEREDGRALHEAIIEAGVRRFQPIIMTTCTTAMGLLPIIISRDVLFYDLAVVIAGGLLVGTLLTLVVVPCLYAICFGERPPLPKLRWPANQTSDPTTG